MLFGSKYCFFVFFQQGVVVQFSQCQCSLGVFVVCYGGCVVMRVGMCFKLGCQCIVDICC